MIPEDLERQISLAEAEVSEGGALGRWSRTPWSFLRGFSGLFPLLDLCSQLSHGLK